MALGGSWEVIAQKDFSVGGYPVTAKLWARLASQDISGNKSKVDLELDIYFTWWTKSYNTDFYLTGVGWIGYAYREWGNGETWKAASTTISVDHNSDGTGSFSATGGYEFGGLGVGATQFGSGSITLPTIARASVPSINTYPASTSTFTLGDTITIHMNRKSSSFTHTVYFKYGNTSVRVGGEKAVTNNVQFNTSDPNIRDAILALIPASSSYSGTIQVITYNGNSVVGDSNGKSIPYTANVPSTYAPLISNYDIRETSTTLANKGVGDKEVVRFLSQKTISVDVAAQGGASIPSGGVICSNGSAAVQMTLSSGTTYTCVMNSPPTGTFVVKASDSRGLQSKIDDSGVFREYEFPTIQAYSLTRTTATSSTGTLAAGGTFWNGTAGTTVNALDVQYKMNTSSEYLPATETLSSNVWAIDQSVTGLEYTNAYSCEIVVTDSFEQSTRITVNLPPSVGVMQLGDDTVQINNYLLAKNDVGIGTGGNVTVKLSEVGSGLDAVLNTYGSKNLVPMTTGTKTENGITFTNRGTYYEINGTATANAFCNASTDVPLEVGGRYIVSGLHDQYQEGMRVTVRQVDPNIEIVRTGENDAAFTAIAPCYAFLVVFEGTTVNNKRWYPMIRDARIASDEYVPYVPPNRVLNSLLTMRNYSWNGTFGSSGSGGSVTRTYQISGKGVVMFNIWAASANQDDTGSIESWVELLNTSSTTQGTLAWDGNRISSSSTFRNATNSAGQWYYDGLSTSRRLRFYASNTKFGTTSWCIRMTTIGCTIAAL